MKGFRERRVLPPRVVLVRALVVSVSPAGKPAPRKIDRRSSRAPAGKSKPD